MADCETNSARFILPHSDNGIVELAQDIYIIHGSTTSGIICVHNQDGVDLYIIDPGPDAKFAQYALECIKTKFPVFTVKALIITHSHADHFGSAAEYVRQTGCEVWTSRMESCGIENPRYQSAVFAGGYPLPEFRIDYFEGEPCTVNRIISAGEVIKIQNVEFKFVNLAGHYFEMLGVVVKTGQNNKAFFISDGIFTRSMLSKFWIPFLYNIRDFKDSLERIRNIEADFYVPAHGEVYTQIKELVDFNFISELSNEETILLSLKDGPKTFEQILKFVADTNEIRLKLKNHMLISFTLRGYITYLYEEQKIENYIEENVLYWKLKV